MSKTFRNLENVFFEVIEIAIFYSIDADCTGGRNSIHVSSIVRDWLTYGIIIEGIGGQVKRA